MGENGAASNGLLDEFKGNPSFGEALLDGAPTGILLVDKEYRIRYLNRALEEWVQRPRKEVLGQKCHEVLFGSEQPCKNGPENCPATVVFHSVQAPGPATFLRQTQKGAWQYLRVFSHPVLDDAGRPRHAVEFFVDVTSEKMLRDYKEEAALRDPLTGLYNRQGFNHHFGRELKRTRRQGHPLCLCLIDIDSFKDYNEKEGEEAGDALLGGIASILASQTRNEVDSLFRLQADTFALILPEASQEQALGIGHRIRHATEQARLPISFSMAICEAEDHEDPDAFYRRAADVLFHVKKAGGNTIL